MQIDVDTRRGVTNLTPIQAACRFGCNASIMRVFIARSAHFSGPLSSASALTMEACDGLNRGFLGNGKDKGSDHLRALLDAGSDPNSRSQSGTTALMLAAKAGNLEMMDLLLLAGADLSAANKNRWTVIHHICLRVNNNERAVFQKLRIPSLGWISRVAFAWRDEYSDVTALHIAASREGISSSCALEEVLESGLVHDLDAISDEGDTALMFAATIGEVHNVKLLLRKGADANLVNMSCGQSALHIAAANGHREIASLLVCHGCELSAKDLNDLTPAICAYSNGHRKLGSILNSYPSSEGLARSWQDPYDEDCADHQLSISQELREQARVTRRQ